MQLFAENLTQTPKHGSLLEKVASFAKSTIFHAFTGNEALFATFTRKVD